MKTISALQRLSIAPTAMDISCYIDAEKIDETKWFDFDKLPAPLHSGIEQTLAWLGERIEKHFK